jgi:hypothetical protein
LELKNLRQAKVRGGITIRFPLIPAILVALRSFGQGLRGALHGLGEGMAETGRSAFNAELHRDLLQEQHKLEMERLERKHQIRMELLTREEQAQREARAQRGLAPNSDNVANRDDAHSRLQPSSGPRAK